MNPSGQQAIGYVAQNRTGSNREGIREYVEGGTMCHLLIGERIRWSDERSKLDDCMALESHTELRGCEKVEAPEN